MAILTEVFFRSCPNTFGNILVSVIWCPQLKSDLSLSNQIFENYLEKNSLKTKSNLSNGILKDKASYISSYVLSFVVSEVYAVQSQDYTILQKTSQANPLGLGVLLLLCYSLADKNVFFYLCTSLI